MIGEGGYEPVKSMIGGRGLWRETIAIHSKESHAQESLRKIESFEALREH